jgi:hypothetical protein
MHPDFDLRPTMTSLGLELSAQVKGAIFHNSPSSLSKCTKRDNVFAPLLSSEWPWDGWPFYGAKRWIDLCCTPEILCYDKAPTALEFMRMVHANRPVLFKGIVSNEISICYLEGTVNLVSSR